MPTILAGTIQRKKGHITMLLVGGLVLLGTGCNDHSLPANPESWTTQGAPSEARPGNGYGRDRGLGPGDSGGREPEGGDEEDTDNQPELDSDDAVDDHGGDGDRESTHGAGTGDGSGTEGESGGTSGGTGGDLGGGTEDGSTNAWSAPESVSDLEASGLNETSVTLTFTEVDDGSGQPARYHVRYAPAPIGWGWGSATVVASGGCGDPIEGRSIGATLSCQVTGLTLGASYDFQLVSFRDDGGERVFGDLSNIAAVTVESPVDAGGGTTDDGSTDHGSTGTWSSPGQVSDLKASGPTETSVTLSFTEVDDGSGKPAEYQIRYAAAPIGWGWGSATIVTSGSCGNPVQGGSIGSTKSCTVTGLATGTSYDFQLVSFRDEGEELVFGDLSNAATVTTQSSVDTGGTTPTTTTGWPNMPAGFVTLSDQPWNALQSGGWGHQNRAAESRIVHDPTAPFSPGNVLEHVYPRGFTNVGSEPAVDWFNLRGRTEIYAGMWFKASDPWHGHSTRVNKLFFVWSGDHRSSVVFSMYGPNGGPYYFMPVLSGHPDARTRYLEQNVRQVPMQPGKWHRLEAHIAVRSSGRSILRWYQDGVLVGEITDLTLNSTGFGEFQIAPTWGGQGGSDKAQDDYFRYDHVYLGEPGVR